MEATEREKVSGGKGGKRSARRCLCLGSWKQRLEKGNWESARRDLRGEAPTSVLGFL